MTNMPNTNHGERQVIPVVRELTADTITDEQIHTLLADSDIHARHTASAALFDVHSVGANERRKRERARCAEILNARAVKVQP